MSSMMAIPSPPCRGEASEHSFRYLLEKGDPILLAYVTSDARNAGLQLFIQRLRAGQSNHLAIDIGCGSGSLSRALASSFHQVLAVDQNRDNLRLSGELAGERDSGRILYLQANALNLAIRSARADLALLNGVLEWVGVNAQGMSPRAMQLAVLRETRRCLRDSGCLYLAIENRWYPRFLLRDPHTRAPLVNLLPRPAARMLGGLTNAPCFQTWIYGKSALRELLIEAGFQRTSVFTALPGYHFPFAFISLESPERTKADLAGIDVDALQLLADRASLGINAQRLINRVRLRAAYLRPGLWATNFVMLAFPE